MKQVVKNIIIAYKGLFIYSKSARWQVPLYAIIQVVAPLTETAVPAMAIALFTGGNLTVYLVGITGMIMLNVLVKCLGNIMLEDRFSVGVIGSRLTIFTFGLLKKYLTMDYCNMEPAGKQKVLDKGMRAGKGRGPC